MRTVRAVAELRTELAPGRRAGLTIGLVPTMGALHDGGGASRSCSSRAGAERVRRGRGRRCSWVPPSSTSAATSTATRATSPPRPGALGPAKRTPTCCSPAVRRRSTPHGFATTVEVARRERAPGGPEPRCRALPRRRHGGHQAALHGAAGRGLLRPEGRSAGRRDPPSDRRPQSPRGGRGLPHGARGRRAGHVQPQRAALARRAPARPRCTQRSSASACSPPRASRRPRCCSGRPIRRCAPTV